MAKYIDDTIVIESPTDLENELCRYNCKTKEELEDLLWFQYAVTLTIAYEDEYRI